MRLSAVASVFIFLLLAELARAQDLIVLNDSLKLQAYIKEIGVEVIRYKKDLADIYTLEKPKSEVAYVIFKQGETLKFPKTIIHSSSEGESNSKRSYFQFQDSILFYKYQRSISLNLLSFINNEIGLIYQQDFLKKHINLMVPVSVGYKNPWITQRMDQDKNIYFTAERKWFETGIGLHFIPKYKNNFNFFVGPDLRIIAFGGTQVLLPGRANPFVRKETVMLRTALNLSIGYIVRTRNNWQISTFVSTGIKADAVPFKIVEPYSKRKIDPITTPFGFNIWTGFMVGYLF